MTMTKKQYLNLLVNEFHSATMATIGADGHPVTRIIDLMLWDESGVYFLTAKGKSLYTQLMEQKFIALSATAEKRAISLRGKIKNIHSEKLEEIFERNPYMKEIYPDEISREVLEVFQIDKCQGEYFDLSQKPIYRQ